MPFYASNMHKIRHHIDFNIANMHMIVTAPGPGPGGAGSCDDDMQKM